MFPSERLVIKTKKREITEGSLDKISISSNNSFYDKLDLQSKKILYF